MAQVEEGHEATAYAREVVSGAQPAGEMVRQACARHLRDMDEAAGRGLVWDVEKARAIVRFFEKVLVHSKGEWAGQPVVLEPWEKFILQSVFAWVHEDSGARRFRTAYVEVPRKNGKTLLVAGAGLYMTFLDGEGGAEVYSAATTREQARLSHGEAVRMVKQSPMLRQALTLRKDNIHHLRSFSKFEPLASDYNSLDGLNVHGGLMDEVHAWKGRELWDVLQTATGARRQPLLFAITTAGYDRQSLCFQLHDYAEKVASGAVEDDSFFGVIYTIDEGDEWEDEATWFKANPNLGVSKKVATMRMEAAQAKEMPAALNSFLRLQLNVWTQSEERWVKPEVWRACGVELPDLTGRRCYAGLDLSTTTDISAWVLVFPLENGVYAVLPRFFIPQDNMVQRERRDRVPFSSWVRQGFVTATPGNVIDYAWILDQIERDAAQFDLAEIAFDRWGATLLVQQMQERGLNVVEFGQGFASMSAPMKELEKLLLAGKLWHGGNPVLTWMADNVVASMDPAGNVKPDKKKSTERIDGIVATVMGLDRALRFTDTSSVYAGRGLRVL